MRLFDAVVQLCLPPAETLAQLPGGRRPASIDLKRTSPGDLLDHALRLGVFSGVYRNLRRRHPDVVASLPPEWTRLFRHHAVRNAVLYREEMHLLKELRNHGIHSLPLKGVTQVERLYPDLSWRAVADIDLLVAPAELIPAYEQLKSLGLIDLGSPWTREALERAACSSPIHYFEVRLVTPADIPVELHWDWPGERLPTHSTYDEPEEMMIYLCRHAGQHFWSGLQWVADVELARRQLTEIIDWRRFWRLAERGGWERACSVSFQVCQDLFCGNAGFGARPASAAGARLGRQAARALREGDGLGWLDHERIRLLKVDTWPQRFRRIAGWLSPAPRHWSRPAGSRFSTLDVWIGRYLTPIAGSLARKSGSAKWKSRAAVASQISLREWAVIAEAYVLLGFAQAALRWAPSDRLLSWASSSLDSPQESMSNGWARASRIAWLVDIASRRRSGPVMCLPRSLVLTRLLARRGIPAKLLIGLRHAEGKVTGHAWVELGGQAIRESPDPRGSFSVVAERETGSLPADLLKA